MPGIMPDVAYEKFKIPPDFDLQSLPGSDEKICVVSIIGKSSQQSHFQSKASVVNPLVSSDVFLGYGSGPEKKASRTTPCPIEGYYDEENHVIYLHVTSAYDTSTFSDFCQQLATQSQKGGSHQFWQNSEQLYVRTLMYIFTVSHIIIMSQPGNSFDISCLRLFRVMDIIRQKLQPAMSEVLRTLPISKDWVMSGRPCSPRVLFLCETSNLQSASTETEAGAFKTRRNPVPPIKHLQHSIEDQIYRILRKARIITNISNNSLFAIPANQEFVFIQSKQSETKDPVGFYLSQLRHSCIAASETDGARGKSYQTSRRTNHASGDASSRSPSTTAMSAADTHDFKSFLWQHIELAKTKGFDDNTGRNPIPAIFELPTLELWAQVSQRMHDFFLVDQTDTKIRPHFNTLKSLLEIDNRFSESRCLKVLPLASSVYQENLPPHYTQSYHLNKLMAAKRVLAQHARGPACEKYIHQLEMDCEKLWRSGRQLCEQISLTGNPCASELHRLADETETEANKQLPVMPHSSKFKTKSSCNCGRKQAERDDPFDHKAANYDFYQKLEQACCGKLERRIALPVFQSSVSEARAGVSTSSSVSKTSDTGKPPLKREPSKIDITQPMSNLSLALSLGQSGNSDIYNPDDHGSFNSDPASQSEVNDDEGEEEEEEEEPTVTLDTQSADGDSKSTTSKPIRQHSTTEYLPGMIHTEAVVGLLPKFPSWSLVSMAKYSTYNPSQGLDISGFMHGSNFLLPWDVSVRGDPEKWPSITETSGRNPKFWKGKKEVGEMSLRVYFGMEYECPRGHRFTCSGPDKVFKAPSNGNFKENAQKLITMDMPLYFPCHCRSSKGFFGQLMRIYVAVPDGPVEVHLKPQVQPGLAPCPTFYPGNDGPIHLLPGHIWVLRLPYVYLGEKGPFLMPNDPQQIGACRILKGLFSLVEVQKT